MEAWTFGRRTHPGRVTRDRCHHGPAQVNAFVRRAVATVTRLSVVREPLAEDGGDRRGAEKNDHHGIEH